MTRVAARSQAALRCPWCHASGGAFVPCPRDATPIHPGCLEEFGSCPTCRGAVEERAVRRSSERVAFSIGPDPLELPPLGFALEWFVAELPAVYRRERGWRRHLPLVLLPLAALVLVAPALAVTLVVLAGAALLGDAARRRAARPWRTADALAAPGHPLRRLAEEVAERDERALADVQAHEAGRSAATLLRAQVEELEVLRRERYRQTLERGVPIDGVGHFAGVGQDLVQRLRDAGVDSLRDLLATDVPFEPSRAERLALESWAEGRRLLVEAWLAQGHVPGKERIDAWIEERSADVRRWALGRVSVARQARRRLEAWRAERRGLLARLGA